MGDVVEGGAFALFVADFLKDFERLFEIAQGGVIVANMMQLFAGLSQCLATGLGIGRLADGGQPVGQQRVIETIQTQAPHNPIQCQVVGLVDLPGAAQGGVGGDGLGQGGPFVAEEIVLIGGGRLQERQVGREDALARQPVGHQRRELKLVTCQIGGKGRLDQRDGQQPLQQQGRVGQIGRQLANARQRHRGAVGGQPFEQLVTGGGQVCHNLRQRHIILRLRRGLGQPGQKVRLCGGGQPLQSRGKKGQPTAIAMQRRVEGAQAAIIAQQGRRQLAPRHLQKVAIAGMFQ